MIDLFSEDPTFRRTQYTKVSDNVQEWPEQIAALVSEQLPPDMGLDVQVVLQKTDREKGYGIGTAIVRHPNAPKAVGIPIIIKAWHLAPLDLFFEEDKLYFLSPDRLARAFFSANVGAGLAPVKPPPQMQDDQGFENRFPPIGGKYASVIDAIGPVRGEVDIAALRDAIKAAPTLLAKFAAHGTFEVLTKWAAKKEPAAAELDVARALKTMKVKKHGPDEYQVFASGDDVFDPIALSLSRRGLADLFELKRVRLAGARDPMQHLDRNGELTLVPPEESFGKPVDGTEGSGVDGSGGYGAELGERRSAFVFNPLQDERATVQAEKFGRYGVTDQSGVLAKGWVLPNVVTFDGKKTSLKLFVSRALAAMQHRIAGVPLGDDPMITLPSDGLQTGQMGTLVHVDGKRSVATVPFTILGVTEYGGQHSIAIVDYEGRRMNLIPSVRAEGIAPIASSEALGPLLGRGRTYLVPARMVFVKFPKLTSVSESADAFRKVARERALDAMPLKVSKANGRFVFRGVAVDKYAAAGLVGGIASVVRKGRNIASQVALKSADATKKVKALVQKTAFDPAALERDQAEFLLAAWGLGQEKIAEVIERAGEHVVLEVHHLRYPRASSAEKTATAGARAIVARMKPDMTELIKAAAMLDGADAVDTVLGLGFVNPENVERFASVKPTLEDVSSVLAKLVLGARLGMEDLPEDAARSAMLNLERVIDGLTQLKMLATEPSSTAGARGRAA